MMRTHEAHFIQDTSRISYGQIKENGLGEKQRIVYDQIKKSSSIGLYQTDREIAQALGFRDPNKVRPRRFELVAMGLVEEAGKKICSISGRLSISWKIPGSLDNCFFSQVGDTLVQSKILPKDEWDSLKTMMESRGYVYSGDGAWRRRS